MTCSRTTEQIGEFPQVTPQHAPPPLQHPSPIHPHGPGEYVNTYGKSVASSRFAKRITEPLPLPLLTDRGLAAGRAPLGPADPDPKPEYKLSGYGRLVCAKLSTELDVRTENAVCRLLGVVGAVRNCQLDVVADDVRLLRPGRLGWCDHGRRRWLVPSVSVLFVLALLLIVRVVLKLDWWWRWLLPAVRVGRCRRRLLLLGAFGLVGLWWVPMLDGLVPRGASLSMSLSDDLDFPLLLLSPS